MALKFKDYVKYKKIISLYRQGYSYTEIGNMFGLTRQRIHQIVKELSSDESKPTKIYKRLKKHLTGHF